MQHVATLIRQRKIEEAEAELNRTAGSVGRSATWRCHRGLLLEARGEVEPAIEAFRAALDADPAHAEARFHLARVLDLHGDEDEGVSHYETLARRRPAHVNGLLNLAVIYEDRGRYAEAYDCVRQVLSEHPNQPRARLFLRDIESSTTMVYDETQERNREKRDAILETPVSDFELSVRSRNCLKKMNINTLGDLLRITESELLSYKNFGETSLSEIKLMLKQKGLRLGQLREELPPVTPRPPPPRLSLPGVPLEVACKLLSEIEFSGRSRKCLQRLNLVALGDVAARTENELLAIKNFGQTSLNEVKQKLAQFGLSLRKKPE